MGLIIVNASFWWTIIIMLGIIEKVLVSGNVCVPPLAVTSSLTLESHLSCEEGCSFVYKMRSLTNTPNSTTRGPSIDFQGVLQMCWNCRQKCVGLHSFLGERV